MNWFKQLLARRRRYAELSESIQEHIEEKIDDLMEDGMSREEAERIARREFGNVTLIKERSREVWQWPTVEGILWDLRYGFRRLRKSPGFTFIVLLTFGLGIGANIAVYSLVDVVLLRPLQFGNEKRLVQVFEERPTLGLTKDTPAPGNYFDWKRRNHVFSDMAAALGEHFRHHRERSPWKKWKEPELPRTCCRFSASSRSWDATLMRMRISLEIRLLSSAPGYGSSAMDRIRTSSAGLSI